MKLLAQLSASAFLIGLVSLLFMCKKETGGSTDINHPPVANAGADITLDRVTCSWPNSVRLNASNSSDPDHDKLFYQWTKISGPFCSLINGYSAVAEVNDLQMGQYAFELNLADLNGLSSKDTVVIDVSGSPSPIEVSLDVKFGGNYNFTIYDGAGSYVPFFLVVPITRLMSSSGFQSHNKFGNNVRRRWLGRVLFPNC